MRACFEYPVEASSSLNMHYLLAGKTGQWDSVEEQIAGVINVLRQLGRLTEIICEKSH